MAPPGYVSPVPPPIVEAAPTGQSQLTPGQARYYTQPPVARKPRTADVAVTCILLTVGLISVLISLSLPPQIASVVTQVDARYGVRNPDTTGVAALGLGITISQIAIYLVALGVSIPLMVKRRLAFWVPLTAGAVAAIAFWVLFVAALLSDPRVLDAIQNR
jgi:uncharacterized BrkB/YihY/UPF0761 family membrane protein